MTSFPVSRASQAREALRVWLTGAAWTKAERDAQLAKVDALIPEGAIILTADEVEQVRHELLARRVDLGSHLEYDTQPRRLNREALALLSGGAGEATPA